MNGVLQLLDGIANFGARVGTSQLSALSSLALALLVPYALCACNFALKKARSAFVHWVLAIIGVIAGSLIPIERAICQATDAVVRTFILILCIAAIIYVSRALPFFLAPQAGRQAEIRRILMGVIGVLLAFAIVSKEN